MRQNFAIGFNEKGEKKISGQKKKNVGSEKKNVKRRCVHFRVIDKRGEMTEWKSLFGVFLCVCH